MQPVEIIILLKRAGVTQTSLAEKLGVTVPFINHVIMNRRATKRVRKAIAKAVRKSVRDLWPTESSKPQDHVGSGARKAA